eukprot:scaffold19253_cov124-Isochrysis_galbana.AAC.4
MSGNQGGRTRGVDGDGWTLQAQEERETTSCDRMAASGRRVNAPPRWSIGQNGLPVDASNADEDTAKAIEERRAAVYPRSSSSRCCGSIVAASAVDTPKNALSKKSHSRKPPWRCRCSTGSTGSHGSGMAQRPKGTSPTTSVPEQAIRYASAAPITLGSIGLEPTTRGDAATTADGVLTACGVCTAGAACPASGRNSRR